MRELVHCGIWIFIVAGCQVTPPAGAPAVTDGAAGAADSKLPHRSSRYDPFGKGQWTSQFYGSSVSGRDRGLIASGHLGFGYHLFDGGSINVEGFFGGVSPQRYDRGVVGGVDILFRCHFLRGRGYSLFFDVGSGFQQASTRFPDYSRYNFRPQCGFGATLEIVPEVHFIAGARWLHISNAGLTHPNNGLDDIQMFAGLLFPF